VRSGSFKERIEIPLTREMHPEFRKLDATVSALPLGLARGLDAYLKDFPFGWQRTNHQRRVLPIDAG